jgi:hypothetical protein
MSPADISKPSSILKTSNSKQRSPKKHVQFSSNIQIFEIPVELLSNLTKKNQFYLLYRAD